MSTTTMDNEPTPVGMRSTCAVPPGDDRLFATHVTAGDCDVSRLEAALRGDRVVLIEGAAPEDADRIVGGIAERFGLLEGLEKQAAFAAIHGHRQNSGRYFMSVNQRRDYQSIAIHSEGTHFLNFQLAAVYCYENTTDGGVTVLLNTDQGSGDWRRVREIVVRLQPGGPELSPTQRERIKVGFQMDPLKDVLTADDQVLEEVRSPVEGRRFFRVSSQLRKRYSVILDREVYAYWDNIDRAVSNTESEYAHLLRSLRLFREAPGAASGPPSSAPVSRDGSATMIGYERLFRAMIVRKLVPGELMIQNNLTWTHSASHWTPGSGSRKLVVAFA